MVEKKKSNWFKAIESKEEALKTIKDSAYGFMFVAALQGVIGYFIAHALIVDGIIYLVLALLLFWLKSRIIAIILLLFSGATFVTTIMNRLGMMKEGGNNIFLAIIIFWAAVKAVEATFKLHGKYKEKESITPIRPLLSRENKTLCAH